jgi:hypothetical protein
MWEFLDVAYCGFFCKRDRIDPDDIKISNPWSLGALVPLVFDNLPTGSIKVWEGMPFHAAVPAARGTGSPPAFPDWIVEEAERKGKLRKKALRPTDNPLEAADKLFEEIARAAERKGGNRRRSLHHHLRQQAWRAVGHLFGNGARASDIESEPIWEEFKARGAQLKLHWDDAQQEYRISHP